MTDIRKETKGDRTVVTLSGELTVQHAREMQAALLDAVRTSAGTEVVVGQIAALDCSFPQLICSAHRMAADLNKELTVTGADQERFGEMLRRSGFNRHIGCQENTRKSCLWLHGRPAA